MKKLSLNKETIRVLADRDLSSVEGGGIVGTSIVSIICTVTCNLVCSVTCPPKPPIDPRKPPLPPGTGSGGVQPN